MALNPPNSSNLEQLALKGLNGKVTEKMYAGERKTSEEQQPGHSIDSSRSKQGRDDVFSESSVNGVSASRFSVHLVCGIRLNIPRSSSLVRSVSISCRCPGTAVMPATPWRQQRTPSGTPTAGCSALWTTITTLGEAAARWRDTTPGGMATVRPVL